MSVCGTLRRKCDLEVGIDSYVTQQIDGETCWSVPLDGCNVVVHLAGRAHILNERSLNSLNEFRRVNTLGSLNLARQAADAGVERFVFVSSIGVNGAQTMGQPFTPENSASPHSPYALSKYEAECDLRILSKETGMEIVVVRPPLVYGPGTPGNFGLLVSCIEKGIPLPLGAVQNRRSLVALANLVDLLYTCISHPRAANQTFLVSDDEDLSTTELLVRMGEAMGKRLILLPVPSRLLEIGAVLLGRTGMAQSLLGDLQVDIAKTREMLDWIPPVDVSHGLRLAVARYQT
jgi:nucleoside-diphosphate-sugar epimerase